MSNPTTPQSTVRRSLLARKTLVECMAALESTSAAGASCPEVQASPFAQQAHALLQKAVTTASGSFVTKQAAAQSLTVANKAFRADFKAARVALAGYETAVANIAGGSAAIINKAGIPARDQAKRKSGALSAVTVIHTKPGKRSTEAILTWPAAPGATGYAIEVNFTPQAPNATWVTLPSGTGRRRIVKAPAPGAQFLVRIASLGSGGTQSDWSAPVMATAL
jgi:hypothetical protein